MFEYMTVRELYEMMLNGSTMEIDSLEYVQLEGWIRTNRCNGKLGFIELNDGSYFRNCQLVYKDTLKNFAEIEKYATGSAISIIGKLKATPEGKQPFEVEVTESELVGACDSSYPLQKKRHSFEYMREIAHLRPRANTFYAIFRLRSVLSMAIHEFFQNQGFVYVHTPIITGNDAEGAGESFTVTTRQDGAYEKDFFGKHAALTVSGQLHAEAFALAFRDVYTFGPTFRAENSNTSRHASEFWMIEPEIAFADLDDDMDLIEDMVKFCIDYVLENAPEEMKFFNSMIDKEAIERITKVRDSEFKRMTYTEAVEHLQKADVKFEYPVEWGTDLQSEHERYICEKIVDGPVFLTDYPKDIKAFYMRMNDDGKTVAACDLLVPGVGELVGGSQREERYDVLLKRMNEMGIEEESLDWYMDLRKYGGCKHAGFGLGFDRFLMYITGMQNIRDVQPFARTPKNLNF
ncbi:asparaginyl-tRNA synthetase [Breznakia sp. PF5-3]|uniref:asparagine--tRNA ligase n=1 Tax=unclassified Breznakia TaxID=2623764 RepID=UPI002406524F|nr:MULTISPECIES: asparagine--tRNA ligase [unclassified Breznakia]MDF9824473.1 asparaginyl-tRNA synthetase [Breznakia sp. PM6-1]MDF9835244.1 asparaginyl-tRNA synthetase [Breznakia sp. PF5-3]MDF9837428.1 asparaginyl-tRNA synthetase [Breznakia sp. PFB2-8]MDF9859364.1 asparaginyl-tRNA synthetase [Breznakia sp. PH5-24]